jgi:hypothetical protein
VTVRGQTCQGVAADGEIQRDPTTKNLGRRRAAGIYGAIVTAAILDTVGGHVSTAALVVSVVVALLVYWLAEEYAEVLGAQVEGGRLPSRASIWEALAATWPMITCTDNRLRLKTGRLPSRVAQAGEAGSRRSAA